MRLYSQRKEDVMFFQILECVIAGMGIGFDVFFKAFPLYLQLKSIPINLIAIAIGVPALICKIVVFLFRFSARHIKN